MSCHADVVEAVKDEEVIEDETDFSKARRALVSAETSKKAKGPRHHKVDPHCSMFGAVVVDDWDCMLNQTNIGHNNNKFYVIQMLKTSRLVLSAEDCRLREMRNHENSCMRTFWWEIMLMHGFSVKSSCLGGDLWL
jgi:hypothetical protein